MTDDLSMGALTERMDAILLRHSETLDPALVEEALRVRWRMMAVKLHEVMERFNADMEFDRHALVAVDAWLLSQILYYRHSMPVLTDAAYDALSRYLLEQYDRLIAADPIYARLIQRNHLESGSGEDLIEPMPQMIKLIALSFPR